MTDHKALEQLMTKEIHKARDSRWLEMTQMFSFEIEHMAGKDNVLADALSRIYKDPKEAEQGELLTQDDPDSDYKNPSVAPPVSFATNSYIPLTAPQPVRTISSSFIPPTLSRQNAFHATMDSPSSSPPQPAYPIDHYCDGVSHWWDCASKRTPGYCPYHYSSAFVDTGITYVDRAVYNGWFGFPADYIPPPRETPAPQAPREGRAPTLPACYYGWEDPEPTDEDPSEPANGCQCCFYNRSPHQVPEECLVTPYSDVHKTDTPERPAGQPASDSPASPTLSISD